MRSGRKLILILTALLILSAVPLSAQDEPLVVRIGHQRGDYYTILRDNGDLEAALKAQFGEDTVVEFTLFTSGPPLLEALNGGSIDIGWTGNTPPIFAQSAGVPLVYIASQITATGHAVLVPENSDIQTVADLKGKTVAFTSGSSANYFIIQALDTVGLDYSDIEPVLLQPADARAAFEGGSVDAWSIWDPFMTAAVAQVNARPIIVSAEVEAQRAYQLATATFAEAHPEVVSAVLDVVQNVIVWAQENPEEHAAFLEEQTQVPVAVWLAVKEGNPLYGLEPLYNDIVEGQQTVADKFFALGLIPEAVDIASAVWLPEGVDPTTLSITAPQAVEAEATTAP